MVSEIKVNFDFGKLADDMPKIIKNAMKGSSNDTVKASKEFIKSGKVKPVLEKTTKQRRKRAGYPATPPLYMTHALHNSIISTKDGIEMNDYGYYHHTGDGNKKRPFIQFTMTDETKKKFDSDIRKSLHLKTPLVLKT